MENKRGIPRLAIISIVALFLLIVLELIYLFSSPLEESSPQEMFSGNISNISLNLSVLPEGYVLETEEEVLPEESSDWIEGYFYSYILEEDNEKYTRIELFISRYPTNITKIIFDKKLSSEENFIVNYFDPPPIGEGSESYSFIYTNEETGEEIKGNVIRFLKKDIVIKLTLYGQIIDYELIERLSRKIEEQI